MHFFYHAKKFYKIISKIKVIQAYLKSNLFSKGTLGLLIIDEGPHVILDL